MKHRILAAMALTLVMCLGMVVPALAANGDITIEVGPFPGLGTVEQGNENDIDYEAIIDEMVQNRLENHTITQEEREWAQNIINLYDEYYDDGIMTLDSVSENKKKLRTGNLIELTLDLDEGMSNTEALKAIALSRTAESEASKNFSDYQDCAQHFIWNFKMTSSLSKTKARTVGTNHEWGISLINPLERYFDEAYENYLSDGYSSDEASNKAFTDTVFNIPAFKYETVLLLQSSYSFFTSFFTDECIMDFWNNCYGRSYVEKGYSDGVSAFRAALNANELVLDGIPMAANLTQTQKRNVWSWDWYSY